MKLNTKKYIEEFIKIKNKDGKIVPFILNEPQNKLYDIIKDCHEKKKPIRIIILKARQMGFSTATGAIMFKNTSTKANISSGIITHIEEATTNLFNMYKLMYEQLPTPLKPSVRASNSKELIFDTKDGQGLKSKIKCMTAGSSGVGRSSTIQYLHISEYAFWQGDKKATLNGLMQAVPSTTNSMVIIESTANGYEHFRELWYRAVNGESDFIPLFVGWNELKEYSKPYTGFELTEYEKEIKARFKLTNDQLQWRRWSIENNCSGDEDMFRQEYPITPEEAFIGTGHCIFDQDILTKRMRDLDKPYTEGNFEYDRVGNEISNIKFVKKKNGNIRIYDTPVKGKTYAIGGDTAGEGSDYFAGQVIDSNGKQVAILEHQFDEDMYANQMYCLGWAYNKAIMNVETNFSTYPIKELEKMEYPNLWYREVEDSISKRKQKSYGFKTTKVTKPIIIGNLVKIARENPELINDKRTIQQMLTYVKNEKGGYEAESGYHDDLVMSLAIAYYSLGQIEIPEVELKKDIDLVKQFYGEDDRDTYQGMPVI